MQDIVLKLTLTLLFSGLIGYEREMSRSNAGFKTHIIVGLSSALIAIVQLNIMEYVVVVNFANPDIYSGLRSDPTRLIAQVISGIGFLGAGTIIVTKSNVSGLTTAASIWSVAILGISTGMGYYSTSIIGFIFIILVLYIFNRVFVVKPPEKVIVKYIKADVSAERIDQAIKGLNIDVEIIAYDTDTYGDELISKITYQIHSKEFDFDQFIRSISNVPNVISVHKTNL